MHPEPVEYGRRRAWSPLGVLGSLLFVALGAWLALRPESDARTRLVGVGNALFFGLCAAVYAWSPRAGGPRLRLDAAGLHHRPTTSESLVVVPWSAVAAARVVEEGDFPSVVVTLAPTGGPWEAVPDWAAARGAVGLLASRELALSPRALGVSAEALRDDVERFRRYYGAPKAL